MKYLFGALLGLVWGAGAAILSAAVTGHFVKKQNVAMILAGNIIRFFVDVAALGMCLLLRNSEGISFYTAIVGTAASLSILTIIFAYKMAKPDTDTKADTDTEADNTGD